MNSGNNPSDPASKTAQGFAVPMAYVRPVSSDEKEGYAVYAADGTQLAVFTSRDAAFYAAKQHDLAPVLVH